MLNPSEKYLLDYEDDCRVMVEAADRIGDLFEEYEITQDDIERALKVAAQKTLAEMYPELLAEAV
jgi:hypothetical protein